MIDSPDNLAKSIEVADRLKLIANPNRLRIMCQLVKGEFSVGDIEIKLGIKQPTLSREIAKLRDGGVLTARRQSKVVFYSLTDPNMRRLVEAVCAASSDIDFDASKAVLEGNPRPRPERPLSFNPRPKFTALPPSSPGS